jgi:hypothetical protein
MGFLLPKFEEVGHLKNGCYQTDDIIMYVECKGVFLNPVVSLTINFFFQLYFNLAFLAFYEAEALLYVFAFLAWLPMYYLLTYSALQKTWKKLISFTILIPTIYAISIINFAT